MESKIEVYTAKTHSFFKTWFRKTQQDKKKEVLEAVSSFRKPAIFAPFIRLAHDEFDFNEFKRLFNDLNPLQQYELIKNIILLGPEVKRFYGLMGADAFSAIKFYLPEIMTCFTEEQRIALARIDMERSGINALAQYQLPETKKDILLEQAKVRAHSFLPSLSEEFVKECIRSQDLKALQYHLSRQFSGPLFRVSPELRAELEEKLCEPSANELLDVIYRAKKEQEEAILRRGWIQYPDIPYQRPPHWGKHKKVAGETLVPFSHGGGFFHILDFLTGHSQGYRLENPGHGIQVSPDIYINDRDVFYATNASRNHFDYPARLSGTIKAKYLDKAVNDYEAGLRPDFIGFISNLVIQRIDKPHMIYRIGTIDNKEAFPIIAKPGEIAAVACERESESIPIMEAKIEMAEQDTKPKYEAFSFDSQYANESTDHRYRRLLIEFDAKFTKHLVTLHQEHETKGEGDDKALVDFEKCIEQYEQQVRSLRKTIEFFSTETLKKHPDNNLLTIGGYPSKAYLIELLARTATAIDQPTNHENKIQLLNLANEIPGDTQGYWRHIKVGIIFFLMEAMIIGVMLSTILLFPPLVAPILVSLTAMMVPIFLGSYLMVEEVMNIRRTSDSQKIKTMITSKDHTFFSPSGNVQTEPEEAASNKKPNSSKADIGL